MKIIKPSATIEERDEERGGLNIIEKAARTCYKSEDAITEGSADRIVKALIKRGHESAIEHGDYIFLLDDTHILDNVLEALLETEANTGHRIHLSFTRANRRPIISGNIRAWRELMAADSIAKYYFTGAIDTIYTEDLIPEDERYADSRIHQLRYADLKGALEQRVHLRQTVRFTIDRGISHEFVRHRVMSFSQESSRFCNYSQQKFGREISVIEPCFLVPDTEPYNLWKRQCMSAEAAYFTELDLGLLPQEARAVLPTSTKTELMMTGTLGEWRHFFDLRALEKTGRAHPQAVEVAKPLMTQMASRFPAAFGSE